ncbi:MAG: DUF1080 domain-containing protein [Planctomycetaceae bacterium]|nr:DUF1080 domain-containing protein [Planctomycetaceae bacterium]MCB9951436.1 DUF1080 domain-containing protein [Planctomycetaceae bacterium]
MMLLYGVVCAQEPDDAQLAPKKSLISEEFPGNSWTFFAGEQNVPVSKTWKVETDPSTNTPVLVCTGEPYGYIRTRTGYQEFELNLEWKYPQDQNGNSGILLFTSGDDRIWPDSLQVQLHHSTAGSTFPSGSAKSNNELRNVPALSRPVGQWNECKVISRNGRITVFVNEKKIGEVTGCEPNMGTIALQSEGSEIHFRELWIREFSGTESANSRTSLIRPGRFHGATRYCRSSVPPMHSWWESTDCEIFRVRSGFPIALQYRHQ